ncbi:MAG: GNAT family N-acetyltransferase [Deltaproteobacteria bacterium]|nr:GNAT family N-acetyltransferase [Deltaproteobacteria bacterium]
MSVPCHIFEECPLDEKWDAFVEASPSGTLFSLAGYMRAVRAPVRAFWCLRRKERRAAVVVCESADHASSVPHDFIIHNGLLFAPPAPQQNRSQIISERFDIASAAAAFLAGRYERVELALAPQCRDIRPFLWHNWGTGKAMYRADVRYTAYADLTGFAGAEAPEEIPLFAELSCSRRQEVRKARKEHAHTTEEGDANGLTAFYALTLRRQNIEPEPERLEELRFFAADLLSAGMARLFVACMPGGAPAAMALFGRDAKRAYYLFGAGDPALRGTPCGTVVLWDAFAALARSGCRELDMEGVNSPQRGWFKLSFGAELLPYYRLVLEHGARQPFADEVRLRMATAEARDPIMNA